MKGRTLAVLCSLLFYGSAPAESQWPEQTPAPTPSPTAYTLEVTLEGEANFWAVITPELDAYPAGTVVNIELDQPTPTPGCGGFLVGEIETDKIIAECEGYPKNTFLYWSGDIPEGREYDLPLSLTINADTHVVAHTTRLTPTPIPSPVALIKTQIPEGDFSSPGSEFAIDVQVVGNNVEPVNAFALRVYYDSDKLEVANVVKADLDAEIMYFPPVDENETGYIRVGTLGANLQNTLYDLNIFRLIFRTLKDARGSYVRVGEDPGNVPLVGNNFTHLEVAFSNDYTNPLYSSDPPDGDNDGKWDECETLTQADALDPTTLITNAYLNDQDGDGLLDGQEDVGECDTNTTPIALTHPKKADTDGDGWLDGLEILILESDPLDINDPANMADNDSDGCPAGVDPDDENPDTDGDGFGDLYEILQGASPEHFVSKPDMGDFDNNGRINNIDAILIFNWTLDNGIPGQLIHSRADIQQNGQVDNLDAITLFNWALGLVGTIPTE